METIFGLAIPVTFILMLVLERLFPGRPQPKVRFWALKGLLLFVMCAALGGALPAVLGIVLARHAPFHLTMVPLPVAAVVVWLLGDFINYFVHRVMHNVPFLWRWTHQMHHAAERVDMWGANFIHPVDLVLQTTRARMMQDLDVPSQDLDSIMRMIRSQIDISLRVLQRGRR